MDLQERTLLESVKRRSSFQSMESSERFRILPRSPPTTSCPPPVQLPRLLSLSLEEPRPSGSLYVQTVRHPSAACSFV